MINFANIFQSCDIPLARLAQQIFTYQQFHDKNTIEETEENVAHLL